MFGSENIGRRGSKGSINVDFQGFFQLHFFARTIFGHFSHGIGVGGFHFQSMQAIGVTVSHCRLVQTGVALALMECLNDIGAVEHLGVKTLTVGVYETWLSRGSLEGAARIALMLLGLMALLLLVERYLRAGGIEQKSKHTLAPVLHKPTPLMQGVILIISSLRF